MTVGYLGLSRHSPAFHELRLVGQNGLSDSSLGMLAIRQERSLGWSTQSSRALIPCWRDAEIHVMVVLLNKSKLAALLPIGFPLYGLGKVCI